MAETLPLFPLNAVLLPGAHLPLHIFEPRYRQLTVDLVTGVVPEQRFGVIALRPSSVVEVTEPRQLREIGCSAMLRQAKRLPDGRFDIVTTGDRRFRLLAVDSTSKPYLIGTIEWVDDGELPSAAHNESVALMCESARAAHRRYCEAAWQREDWNAPPEDTEVGTLSHALAMDCMLPIDDRQRLLEETRPLRRLRMISKLLNREAGILAALRAVPPSPSEFRAPTCLN